MKYITTNNDDKKKVARNFKQHLGMNNKPVFNFFQTQARFLSDHSNPTADSLSSFQQAEMLVTSEHTAIPTVRAEDAENKTEVSIEDHPTHKVKVTWLY